MFQAAAESAARARHPDVDARGVHAGQALHHGQGLLRRLGRDHHEHAVGVDAHQAVHRLGGGVGHERLRVERLDVVRGVFRGGLEIAVLAHQAGWHGLAFERGAGACCSMASVDAAACWPGVQEVFSASRPRSADQVSSASTATPCAIGVTPSGWPGSGCNCSTLRTPGTASAPRGVDALQVAVRPRAVQRPRRSGPRPCAGRWRSAARR